MIGLALRFLPAEGPQPATTAVTQKEEQRPVHIDPKTDPKGHEQQARKAELDTRFEQAVAMLHASQYDYAVKALRRVLELSPRMPEAHVNMGYALIGLQQYKNAADFFKSAIDIKPMQLNAYYGLALAYEGEGKLRLALGAMESYIHLAEKDDPYLSKAKSAAWEWNERLASAEASPDKEQGKTNTTN